jgi:sugar/nucleoside kinase (ribokinase family)
MDEAISRRVALDTRILTRLGADERGRVIWDSITKDGIGTDLIDILPDKRTGAYWVSGDKLNYRYDRDDAAAQYIFAADNENLTKCLGLVNRESVIATSGIGASRPLTDEMFNRMIDTMYKAKARGGTIVANASLRPALFPGHSEAEKKICARDRLSRLFRIADTVIFSWPDDDREVFGMPSKEATAKMLLDGGVTNAILSYDTDDVQIHRKDRPVTAVPIIPISAEEIVDTSGGSGALMAGIIAAQLHGLDIENAVHLAMLASHHVMMAPTGMLGPQFVPTVDEMRAVLDHVM